MSLSLSGRSAELRATILRFLQERRDGKLEKLAADDPQRQSLIAQFEFVTWIDDAARRVGQIQAVTHSLKATHPDARGTNFYRPPEGLTKHEAVGSHHLGTDFSGDVVGNAAALDVHKFLKVEYEGRKLLDLMLAGDGDLLSALSDDRAQAATWTQAFTGIVESRGKLASHTQAKQLYWLIEGRDPLEDASYQLLAPVYASSLAHRVFQTINGDRFSESAKLARQARRDGVFSEQGFREYPHLAIQNLGGTKPQNISQLNSERGGNNYLLASLPPLWKARNATAPLRTDSVFHRFSRRDDVRLTLRVLRTFLETNPPSNIKTRNHRDMLVAELIEALFRLEAELASLAPGWSKSAECRLPDDEQLWLDPGRAEKDEDFATRHASEAWPKDICDRFANWLNGRLSGKLLMGDPEHTYWRNLLMEELESRRREGAFNE